jgi:hypothetical protein
LSTGEGGALDFYIDDVSVNNRDFAAYEQAKG